MKRAKLRARNLTDSDIDVIVGIVDGWVGQLTWNGLISAIQLHTGVVHAPSTTSARAYSDGAYACGRAA